MRRFAPRGMRIFAAAAEVSILLGAEEISTGHILIALTETPGPVADALAAAGADATAVARAVAGDADRWPRTLAGFVPFSAEAEHVGNLAPQLAWEAGRSEATDVDLLAALAELPACSAMVALAPLGLRGDDLRRIARESAG